MDNCEITSLKQRTGQMGDGTPAMGAEMLPATITEGGRGVPCAMRELTTYETSTLTAAGIRADRIIEIPRAALTALGVPTALGTRLIVQRLEPAPGAAGSQPAAETRDVIDQKEARPRTRAAAGGTRNMLQLLLSERRDTSDGGTA